MAIYHMSTKPVSRAKGRSATAAAAYRSGELVHDLSSDQVFDYTRKRGVEHTEIVLPTAAAKADINWARDRQALWNAAEMAEKRKDARVAREYEVALPFELKRAERVELVRAFAAELANRYGVVVDFAMHEPHRSGDSRNYHAHILTTTRELTATGLGIKSSIELSDTDRRKRGLEPAKLEVKAIRRRWEELTNEHLKERGIEARVDHRSLQSQGIEREPTSHLGPAVSAMERRGMMTEVGQRIGLEMASARLEKAAELGRLEREKIEVRQSVLDLSGDLKAAQTGRDLAPEAAAERAPARPKKRGMFDGLELGSGRAGGGRDVFAGVRLSVPEAEAALERVPVPARETALQQSIERYARAWMDMARMRAQELPILEHQRTEFRRAGEELEALRPGAARDLSTAIQFEPETRRAMAHLQGPERVTKLLAGVEHEERIRRDPELAAERFVKVWNGLEARRESLRRDGDREEEYAEVKGHVRELARTLKQSPELEAVLKRRGQELGIEPKSRLARVMEEPELKRALSLSDRELGRGRDLGWSL